MNTVSVRYIVNNVEEAMAFYQEYLGFNVDLHPAPGFAALSQGNLRLLLNQPGAGGAGQSQPGGQAPEPGGWNRIQIQVEDLDARYKELKEKGANFKGAVIQGNGGKQVLLLDPSGNLIELFEPKQRS